MAWPALLPWHALRTPVADVASALSFTTGALGKMAADVLVMTRTEVREVIEPAPVGRGASSTRPQKHNPVLAALITTAARQLPAQALVLHQSMAVEDERSAGGWHAEWHPLRECLRLAAGAAANAAKLAGGLRICPDRMARNLAMTGAAVVSERVVAVLSTLVGKQSAKRTVTDALVIGADLADVLADTTALTPTDAGRLLDPTLYTGVAGLLMDRALAAHVPRSPDQDG